MNNPFLQVDNWTKCLEAFIFLSFLRKFKTFLSFWTDNIIYLLYFARMNSVLKMNFLLNIDPYPIPVINIKNILCNALVENSDHAIFPSLSVLFP